MKRCSSEIQWSPRSNSFFCACSSDSTNDFDGFFSFFYLFGFQQNDDEAERAHRRRTFGKSTTTLSNDSLVEEQQGLQNCLKIFQDNVSPFILFVSFGLIFLCCVRVPFLFHWKPFFRIQKICLRNAWSLTLIDNLANLLGSHHKTLKNFQIVGTSLEATTKIYGLRVDSVHSDIVRMSSGLGRMKSKLLKCHLISI